MFHKQLENNLNSRVKFYMKQNSCFDNNCSILAQPYARPGFF